ncbi:MAG: HlyD family type I secretion periplasmic adaptor subunit [Deltaproteobacteria bacterium]|nr:HlyD family type I secretion periplasmic adaptor subunit [Deltaproteobacteria bacterium]
MRQSPPPKGAPGAEPQKLPQQLVKSLFAPLQEPLRGLKVDDLPFTSEVNAAWAVRPGKNARVLSIAVAALFAFMLLWASIATIDEVTHAEGKVVSSQRTQAIQNLEGGILRAILVQEGQIVEKDAPLARLDNEMAESYFRDAAHKALDNKVNLIRLEAELAGKKPVFPDDLEADLRKGMGNAGKVEGLFQNVKQIIDDQKTTYANRQQQRAAELRVLQTKCTQTQQEVNSLISRQSQLRQSLGLAIKQRNIAQPLLQRKIYSETQYLELEQKVVSLQGELNTLASTIPKARAAAEEARQQIGLRKAELDTAITEEINKRRAELSSLLETLSAGRDRVSRTELRSPVRGTVKQIYINTVGGVVKPGESIMDIVPMDDTLLIEANVRPADVAFLHPEQHAMAKISAYDFSIYGGLEGKVVNISADTVEDQRRGGEASYVVKVKTQKNCITYRGEDLPIIPGMMATVDILTGKKTVLDYLMKPLLKAKQNALRER